MTFRQFRSLVDEFAALRGDARTQQLDRRIAEAPRCPVGRYLRGCARFDRDRAALGVRDLMIAYHAEPELESAALLVFAGLKSDGKPLSLLALLLETWEEFRRPEFDRRPRERVVLDAFDEPLDGLAGLSPLARRLWRLPIARLRRELRAAVESADRIASPLLLAAT